MRRLVLLLLIVDCLLLARGLTRDDGPRQPERIAPPLPLGVERLQLLSEVDAGRGRSEPGPVVAGGVCLRAGPLQDEAAAAAVVERARSLGFAARPEAVELVSGAPDFQVHLPPLPTAEQASRAVRELAGLDMEAFVIPGGNLAGGVSLGTFTSADEAEARRLEVARLGYPVRVVEIPRTRRVWDVHLEGEDFGRLDAFMLGLRADWPGLGSDRVPCAADGPGADSTGAREGPATPAG